MVKRRTDVAIGDWTRMRAVNRVLEFAFIRGHYAFSLQSNFVRGLMSDRKAATLWSVRVSTKLFQCPADTLSPGDY